MVESEQSSNKVEWNMAALLNIELAKLREQANTALIKGDYRKGVDCLKGMAMTSIQVMTPEERSKLKAMEKVFEIPLLAYSGLGSFNTTQRKQANKASLLIREKITEYNEAVMDILNEHGFLGSYQKDMGKMKV